MITSAPQNNYQIVYNIVAPNLKEPKLNNLPKKTHAKAQNLTTKNPMWCVQSIVINATLKFSLNVDFINFKFSNQTHLRTSHKYISIF